MLSAIKAAVKVAKHPEESKHTANDTQQLLYFEDLLGQTVTTRSEVYDIGEPVQLQMHLIQSHLPKRAFLTHARFFISLTGSMVRNKKYALNKDLVLGICDSVLLKRPKQMVNSTSL